MKNTVIAVAAVLGAFVGVGSAQAVGIQRNGTDLQPYTGYEGCEAHKTEGMTNKCSGRAYFVMSVNKLDYSSSYSIYVDGNHDGSVSTTVSFTAFDYAGYPERVINRTSTTTGHWFRSATFTSAEATAGYMSVLVNMPGSYTSTIYGVGAYQS